MWSFCKKNSQSSSCGSLGLIRPEVLGLKPPWPIPPGTAPICCCLISMANCKEICESCSFIDIKAALLSSTFDCKDSINSAPVSSLMLPKVPALFIVVSTSSDHHPVQ